MKQLNRGEGYLSSWLREHIHYSEEEPQQEPEAAGCTVSTVGWPGVMDDGAQLTLSFLSLLRSQLSIHAPIHLHTHSFAHLPSCSHRLTGDTVGQMFVMFPVKGAILDISGIQF